MHNAAPSRQTAERVVRQRRRVTSDGWARRLCCHDPVLAARALARDGLAKTPPPAQDTQCHVIPWSCQSPESTCTASFTLSSLWRGTPCLSPYASSHAVTLRCTASRTVRMVSRSALLHQNSVVEVPMCFHGVPSPCWKATGSWSPPVWVGECQVAPVGRKEAPAVVRLCLCLFVSTMPGSSRWSKELLAAAAVVHLCLS